MQGLVDFDKQAKQTIILKTIFKDLCTLKLQSGLLFIPGTPVQPMVVRPCQYREKDGTYRKKGIDTMTWTWNQNLSLFSLFYLTLAQPRSYFEVSRTSCLAKLLIQTDINLNYQFVILYHKSVTISWLLLLFQIEYLPVYHPSEEEKKDPDLFGANVRAVMAKSLKVVVIRNRFHLYPHVSPYLLFYQKTKLHLYPLPLA